MNEGLLQPPNESQARRGFTVADSGNGTGLTGGPPAQKESKKDQLFVDGNGNGHTALGAGTGPDKVADNRISPLLLLGCYTSFASMYILVSFVAPFFPPNAKRWHLKGWMIGWICACDAIGEVLSTAFATLVLAKMGAARAAVAGQIGNGVSSLLFGLLPLVTSNETVLFCGFTAFRLTCVSKSTVSMHFRGHEVVFVQEWRYDQYHVHRDDGCAVQLDAEQDRAGRCQRSGAVHYREPLVSINSRLHTRASRAAGKTK